MKKMLLMGYSGAGKTSMHSVIFANFPAKDTGKIGYTVERQQHKIKFMGTLTLNLWDCGGQDTFMEQYFAVQRQTIFRGVEVLIYVFDIEDKDQKLKKSLDYWRETLKSVHQYNQKAHIFCLIHKIDKVPLDQRKKRIDAKKQEIEEICEKQKVPVEKFFATSIWDETLYQAWSQIVQLLIPNHQFIHKTLKNLCETSLCSEAVLFERSTFLILSHFEKSGKEDLLKYEKVANIVKQFKLTCKQFFQKFSKLAKNINPLQVTTPTFTALIQEFTKNENILVIYKNADISKDFLNFRKIIGEFKHRKSWKIFQYQEKRTNGRKEMKRVQEKN